MTGAVLAPALRTPLGRPDSLPANQSNPGGSNQIHPLHQTNKKGPNGPFFCLLAEGVGFEPTVRKTVQLISSQARSTTPAPLRGQPGDYRYPATAGHSTAGKCRRTMRLRDRPPRRTGGLREGRSRGFRKPRRTPGISAVVRDGCRPPVVGWATFEARVAGPRRGIPGCGALPAADRSCTSTGSRASNP